MIFMKDRYIVSEYGTKSIIFIHNGVAERFYKGTGLAKSGKQLFPFMNNRYLLFYDCHNIRAIELEGNNPRRRAKFQNKESSIRRVTPFDQGRAVLITLDKYLIILKAVESEDRLKFVEVERVSIQGKKGARGNMTNAIVDPHCRYAIVSKREGTYEENASSVIVYKIKPGLKLEFKASVDTSYLGVDHFYCFEFIKYYGDSFGISCLPHSKNSPLILITYDTRKNRLKVVDEKRIEFQHGFIYKFIRVEEGKFTMVDNNCRVFDLSYEGL